jgi:hypothetical protein
MADTKQIAAAAPRERTAESAEQWRWRTSNVGSGLAARPSALYAQLQIMRRSCNGLARAAD